MIQLIFPGPALFPQLPHRGSHVHFHFWPSEMPTSPSGFWSQLRYAPSGLCDAIQVCSSVSGHHQEPLFLLFYLLKVQFLFLENNSCFAAKPLYPGSYINSKATCSQGNVASALACSSAPQIQPTICVWEGTQRVTPPRASLVSSILLDFFSVRSSLANQKKGKVQNS